jgi:hypothetical protein|tara:strand:- start:73 stop:279 length:207 start_codon:yes stop_codon:yes gene_type:complete
VISKIKNVFRYVGVEGINAKRYLPSAMLAVKKARSEKEYEAIPLLNSPKKHRSPIIMLMPPYKPAISE